jgi:hypothetical protein
MLLYVFFEMGEFFPIYKCLKAIYPYFYTYLDIVITWVSERDRIDFSYS